VSRTHTGEAAARRFLVNVLWNWGSVAANLFLGLLLSPLIIRRLGEERYGIWALVFAMVEYLWMFDLGLRTAVVNRVAHYNTLGERRAVNQVLSVAVFYLSLAAVAVSLLSLAFKSRVAAFFRMGAAGASDLEWLLVIAALGAAFSMAMMAFPAALEATQHFKAVNRNYVTGLFIRAAACAAVLLAGGGLRALALATVSGQAAASLLNAQAAFKLIPGIEIRRAHLNRERFREMLSFGVRTLSGGVLLAILNQGPALIVGRMLPAAFVGFYTLPWKILNYVVEATSRIGFVTAPTTAASYARGERAETARFGMYLNRYCLALFAPVGIYMLVYGRALLERWVGGRFGEAGGPLLAPFVAATLLVMAAQYNTSSMLYGIARHGAYAKILLVETILLLAAFPAALALKGLAAAAWTACAAMVLCRGLATPHLLCRALEFPFRTYMAGIYVKPLLAAVPLVAAALAMHGAGLRGRSWLELAAAFAVLAALQLALIDRLCLEPEHRATVRRWLAQHLRKTA